MDTSKIIVLNPDYHFKNDINRIILYSKSHVSNYSSRRWIGFIHPIQAEILSLFIHKRPLQENINLILERFGISQECIIEIISQYINNGKPIFTEYQGHKVYFPKNVLIDIDQLFSENIEYDFNPEELNCDSVDLSPDRMRKVPQSLLIMLNNQCVTNCTYCYADRSTKYKEMSTSQLLHIIEDAKNSRLLYIDITGGELFLKKDWHIILKTILQHDLSPSYISTKFPLSQAVVKLLYETGYNNVIQLSLDSLDCSNLFKIIGCPNNYLNEIKKGINILQEYGFKIQINTVLTKYNSDEKSICEMYNYIKKLSNLVYWEIRIPQKTLYSSDLFNEVKASKDVLINTLSFIEQKIIPQSQVRIILNKDAMSTIFYKGDDTEISFKEGACGMLYNRLFVLPDGKVSGCEELYWHPKFVIGDLTKQSIQEIWQSERARSLINLKQECYREESPCSRCKIFDFCTENHRKCWVRVLRAYGVDNWDYPDPRCQYAPPVQTDLIYK